MLPFIPIANRRRLFVFDTATRVLQISGSGNSRTIGFDGIRAIELVGEHGGPLLLTVNNEALCWVQNTYTNRTLKEELGAVLKSPPIEVA